MPTVHYLNYDTVNSQGWSVTDEDLFDKAEQADLNEEDYGQLEVGFEESILETAEDEGYDWPYGCRSGFCASCGSVLKHGEIDMANQQVLDKEQIDDGARVTCIGTPDTETVKIIYNASNHI